MIGADPDELDALSGRMNAGAERLGEIRSQLDAQVRQYSWTGGDAEDFQGQWSGCLVAMLDSAASAVGAAGTALAVNARQQREASGDSGTSGGSPLAAAVASGPAAPTIWDLVDANNKLVAGAHLISDVMKAEDVGLRLGVVGVGLDTVTLIHGLATDRHSPATYNAGVMTAIDGAGLAVGVLCPPAGIALDVAGIVYDDYLDKQFPNLSKDIVDGVGAAATAVGKTYVDAVKTDLDAAGAAAQVVSSGVHGVLSHLRF
jgi:uncharacterized protein YukE